MRLKTETCEGDGHFLECLRMIGQGLSRLSVIFAIALGFGACREKKAAEVKVVEEQVDSLVEDIYKKLAEIQVGPLDLKNASLSEAIEFLRSKARNNKPEPYNYTGFSFIVMGSRVFGDSLEDELDGLSGGSGESPLDRSFDLKMDQASVTEILDRLCAEVGYRWFVDKEIFKIILLPKNAPDWVREPDDHEPQEPGDDPFGG